MTVSYWQDQSAQQTLDCDVAVIGAGIVGAYTARCLREAGQDVILLSEEKGFKPSVAEISGLRRICGCARRLPFASNGNTRSPPAEVNGSGISGVNGLYAPTAVAPLAALCPKTVGARGWRYSSTCQGPSIT